MNEQAIQTVKARFNGGEGAFSPGRPLTCGALGVCPLHLSIESLLVYLTYEEALEAGSVKVSEMGEAGSVPELLLENSGAEKVLIIDGQQLVGAKQNRVLNTTVLIAAHSKSVIPVSCVEQGRWHYEGTHGMAGSSYNLYANTRAQKHRDVTRNLQQEHRYDADQQGIWRSIDDRLSSDVAYAPTMAMDDHFRSSGLRLEGFLEHLAIERFEGHDTMVGAVFTLCGKVMGFDAFDRPATLERQWAKLLNSYAIEALREDGEGSVDPGQVRSFLDSAGAADMLVFEPPGLGRDVRITGDTTVGSALVAEGEIAHVYAFNVDADENGGGERPGAREATRMSRYSERVRRNGSGLGGPIT